MASGDDGSPRELLRRGLVDGTLDLAGNCSCAAAHGGLGRLLPKESMGWHLGLWRASKASSGMARTPGLCLVHADMVWSPTRSAHGQLVDTSTADAMLILR